MYEEGYEIVLVADGLKESFDRMMEQHQMSHIFKAEAISEIVGANRFGIRSVLLTWAPRRRMTPESAEEQPTYTIQKPEELLDVVRQQRRNCKRERYETYILWDGGRRSLAGGILRL